MQVSVMMATYLTMVPKELDKQLPSEKSAHIKKILNDPKVTQKEKDKVRRQIQFAAKNKDKLRAQLAQLASPENQKILRPYIGKLAKILKEIKTNKPKPKRTKPTKQKLKKG